MGFAVILMCLAGWMTNYPAILLGGMVTEATQTAVSFSLLYDYAIIVGCLLFARELVVVLRKYIVEKIATELERDEFVSVVAHLLKVEINVLSKNQVGALNIKVNRSIEGVIKLIKLCFLDCLPNLITAITALVIAALFHWSIALVMLVVLILGGSVTAWQVTSQKGIRIDLFRAKEKIGAKLAELILGIEYVRVAGASEREVEKTREVAANLQEKEFLHHKWMMFFDAQKMLIEGIGFIAVIAIGFFLLQKQLITAGDILTFSVLYIAAATPLRDLHRIVDEAFEASLMIFDLRSIYEMKSDDLLLGRKVPAKKDAIFFQCENLSVFIDDGTKDIKVLSNINMQILLGQKIGFAGESGSGKSTLLKVMLGIQSYEGSAKIFGVEVRDLSKDHLAKIISYVPQSPFLFKGSVIDNVAYPDELESVDIAEVEHALSVSSATSFVNNKSEGILHELDEQGRNLSGGERQRLAIARAIRTQCDMLVLDEATSALDAETKASVEGGVRECLADKSIVTVAHRLSSIEKADYIYCFQQGELVEQGNYSALSRKEGYFKELLNNEDLRKVKLEPKVESLAT